MKNRFKSSFNLLVLFALLMMLFGAAPVQSVRAEAAESPLAASGDYVGVTQMGGVGEDKSSDIAVDSSGNIYTTGYFYGTADFAPGLGVFNLTSSGYEDIFISKLNVDGSFAWAKSIGGEGWLDNGNGIAVDVNGNVYITGSFTGTVDFDPGIGIFNLASVGYNDAFISKLDNNGNFVWAKNIGGISSIDNVVGRAIAMDSGGNIFITGYFNGSADFDPGASEYNLTSLYGSSAYILKLNNNGEFVFAKSISGVSINDHPSAVASGIAIDSNNAVYTAGIFYGVVDFDPGSGTFNLNGGSSGTGFLLKVDMNGNLVWAQSMGLVTNDIVLDSSNNAYVIGSTFESINSSGIGADSPFPKFNILVSKLDSNGNLVWKKNMGSAGGYSNGYQTGNGIALDSNGYVYTTGSFESTGDFDPGLGEFSLTSAGYTDIFVSKLDNSGGFVWAKRIGGTTEDGATRIVIDPMGNVYTTGFFTGTVDFDSGAGTANLTSAGADDIFISKLSGDATPTFTDVPFDHPLHDYIEALYDAGYTAGCSTSPMMYCPDTILDRAQSAVFMLRGQMGSGYTPPAAPWNTFVNESWIGFEWAQPWAEGMYQEGLTQGCQSSPLMYCPATQLPRVEASVFGLRMKYGVNYTPPAASGTLFADFPSTDPSYWAIDWAEQAYNDGLLPACGTDSATGKPMFCPSQLVDRGWGAYLIVKAKNLPLP